MTRLERAQMVKVGDRVSVHGYRGVVKDVNRLNHEGRDCTYIKVSFDNPKEIGYQYEGGWYGAGNEFLLKSFTVLEDEEA